MKARSITALKQLETRRRMSAVSQAGRNTRSAGLLQKHASLVGGASKWRIINLEESFAAMAKWAKSAR